MYHIRNTYCENVSSAFNIFIGILAVFESFGCILIGATAFYKLTFYHRRRPFPRCIHFTQSLFFAVSILFGVASLFQAIFACSFSFSDDLIVLSVQCLLRAIQISGYQLILGLRIVHVFDATMYQIRRRYIIISATLWTLILATAVCAESYFWMVRPDPAGLAMVSVILLFIGFVYRLCLILHSAIMFDFVYRCSDGNRGHEVHRQLVAAPIISHYYGNSLQRLCGGRAHCVIAVAQRGS